MGLLDQAEKLCRCTIAATGESAETLNFLGVIHFRRGKKEEALHQFLRAKELDPSNEKLEQNILLLEKEGCDQQPNTAAKKTTKSIAKRNSLVFDIGANVGNKAAEYLEAGCRVVAVEPQKSCAQQLTLRFGENPNVTVVNKALGEEEKVSKLSVCTCANTISTLSEKWKNGRFSNYQWDAEETVQVTTLDRLIDEFGIPDFCKIDVEGYELHVLRGLTRKGIEFVSFEYTHEFFENAEKAIKYLEGLGYLRFNFTLGEGEEFELAEWVDADSLLEQITARDFDSMWGDIYAGVDGFESRDESGVVSEEGSSDLIADLKAKGLATDGTPLRLHLGCGEQHLDGYVNIDYEPSHHTAQTKVAADIFADITAIHFPTRSVDEVRLHHVFEHFDRPKALAQLVRWHEWLKLGGKLHIETPDILGCARALSSNIPYSQKQAILRHAFGSHEAGWAYHYDGWYDEKFQRILSHFGFTVSCRNWEWDHSPYLPNVEAVAIKIADLSRDQLLSIAEAVLRDSMVMDVPSEHEMQAVWCKAMRNALSRSNVSPLANSTTRSVQPFVPTNKRGQNPPAPIRVFMNESEFDASGYDNDQSETNGEYNVIDSLVNPGDVVFDVGANVGRWSRYVLSHVSNIRLHAFEPVPKTFSVLNATLGDSKANAHEVALSSKNGKRTFYYYDKTPAVAEMSSLYRRPGVEAQLELTPSPIEVRAEKLDSFCAEHSIDTINFLKIDTEGGEFDVLKGAAGLLEDHKIAILQFEYGGTYQDAGTTLLQVWQLLRGFGYTLFRILPDGILHIPDYRADFENFRYSNFLAAAPEIAQQLLQREYQRKNNSPDARAITGVIFSKDRPMQLDATLRSFYLHCQDHESIRLKVLYTTSNEFQRELYESVIKEHSSVEFVRERDFREDLLALLSRSGYVLFLVDDNIFVQDFNLADALHALKTHPDAIGFSLRLGENTVYCYPLDKEQRVPEFKSVHKNIIKYDWTIAEYDFGYPLETSSSIYRTDEILPLLKRLVFKNPNSLEAFMDPNKELLKQSHAYLVCFQKSVTFCAPINKVQNVCDNRAGGRQEYTAETLARLFKNGYRIDIFAYSNLIPNACHQEIDLRFVESEKRRTRVSVVIPCHNYADYLPAAVDSVVKQSFKDFEIIIVDDGSTDNTLDVARALQEIDGGIRIKIFTIPNCGPSKARAHGVSMSNGEYLLPLDPDDRLDPDYLLKTVPLLDADPKLGFVYVDTVEFGDRDFRHNQSEYDFKRLCQGNILSYCSLIRRVAFDSVGGYDEGNWGYYEDWDLWIRMGEKGWYGKRVPEPLFFYRHHFNSSLSFYSIRLDPIYRAFIVSRHPGLYSPETVEHSRRLLCEMPEGWAERPPMKDIDQMQHMLLQYPQDRHILYFLGITYLEKKAYGEAEATLSKLLVSYPDDESARSALDAVRNNLKQIENRDRVFPAPEGGNNKSIMGDEHNLKTNKEDRGLQAAEALILKGELMQAESILNELLGAKPDDTDALNNLATIKILGKHHAQAIEYIKKILTLEPSNEVALGNLKYLQAELEQTVGGNTLHGGTANRPGVILNNASKNPVRDTAVPSQNDGSTAPFAGSNLPANPTVSILISTRNRPSFLRGCLESLLAQTFKDFEVIVVNDGGADVEEVVNDFTSLRTKYLTHERSLGLAAGRNTAARHAAGKYVAYLDDDDIYYPNHIETLVNFLEVNPGFKVAYTDAYRAHQELENGQYRVFKRDLVYSYDFDYVRILRENFIPVLCVMHEASCLQQVGSFDESLHSHEDWDLWIRMSRQFKFHHIKSITCEFRWRTDGSSMTSSMQEDFSTTRAIIQTKHRALWIKQAEELITIGDHSRAESLLAELMEREPEGTDSANDLAVLKVLQGKHEEALALLRRVVSIDPENAAAKENIRLILQTLGQATGSRKPEEEPRSVAIQREVIAQAEELMQTKRFDEAESLLQKMLADSPSNSEALNDLAVLYSITGKVNESIALLNKIVSISPANTIAAKNLGSLYLRTNKVEDALKSYNRVLEVSPNDTEALLAIASICVAIGREEDGILLFKRVLTLDPQNPAAMAGLEVASRGSVSPQDDAAAAQTPSVAPPISGYPLVSIVIPVFNKWEFTEKCLESIAKAVRYPNYEVLVVDNASTDGTQESMKILSSGDRRVIYIRNESNLGFVDACNLGADRARGEYVLLLNNDTVVNDGWLESLVAFAEKTPDCGAVGSKLLYPDGRLQEAGGITFADANGWNYGRGMDPNHPKFTFVREVDYVSGASLMVRKSLWEKIGGLDRRYAPAYYEDADLCFAIRKLGYKVYYEPRSSLVHFEGATSGTNLQQGFKKYQLVNRPKFAEKWEKELASQPRNDPRNVEAASSRGSTARILVVDPILPMFDRAAGSLHLFNILKVLRSLNFSITFIATNLGLHNRYKPILEEMGIETYAGDQEAMKYFGHNLVYPRVDYASLFRERAFDFALIDFWYQAEYYLPLIRKYSPRTRIIIDTEDVHFVREIREAELKEDTGLKTRALEKKTREIAVYGKADSVWVVTEQDRQALLDAEVITPIDIRPVIHEVPEVKNNYAARKGILFVGNFNHTPNIDAVRFFVTEVLPEVRKSLPEVVLDIVGNDPTNLTGPLASDKIRPIGYVQDLSKYYEKCRLVVAPLRYGAGLKGKIVEALSYGVPVVTTSIGVEGMKLRDGQDIFVADDPAVMAAKIVEAYSKQEIWERLSTNGRSAMVSTWSFDAGRKGIEEILKPLKSNPRIPGTKFTSIVILTYNQLDYTKITIDSIRKHTKKPYEIIVIDNASRDGTVEYLKAQKDIRAIFNEENLGFPAGCNQGVEIAKGEYVVLLNNDVIVSDNWLEGLIECAESSPQIGIVGPMSNRISGYQLETNVSYKKLSQVPDFAAKYRRRNRKRWSESPRVAGFCMLIKRDLLEKIGGLDVAFGIGNCEDDDYCLRARLAGYKVAIAGDVFIHHFGSKSFGKDGLEKYKEFIRANEVIFEEKWGISPLEYWREGKTPTKTSGLSLPLAMREPIPVEVL